MICPIENDDVELLLAYCSGKVTDPESAQVKLHVVRCPECASFVQLQRAVWNALDVWEPTPVTSDFDRRLYARIAEADREPWYARMFDFVRPVFDQPALPLVAATVIIVAGFFFDQKQVISTTPSQPAAIRVSVTEAEQVERTLDDIQMLHQFDSDAQEAEKPSKSM